MADVTAALHCQSLLMRDEPRLARSFPCGIIAPFFHFRSLLSTINWLWDIGNAHKGGLKTSDVLCMHVCMGEPVCIAVRDRLQYGNNQREREREREREEEEEEEEEGRDTASGSIKR